MKQDYPVPPPELIAKWASSMCGYHEAARWGADQELEACCEWLVTDRWESMAGQLRADRRPKPPSLKEQALEDFDGLMSELDGAGNYSNCAERIRRALEALPE